LIAAPTILTLSPPLEHESAIGVSSTSGAAALSALFMLMLLIRLVAAPPQEEMRREPWRFGQRSRCLPTMSPWPEMPVTSARGLAHGARLANEMRSPRLGQAGSASALRARSAGQRVRIDEEVVVDGNLVSSRNPDDIPAFNREMIRLFARPRRAPEAGRAQPSAH
jgi:hypothetical protein